MTDNDSLHLAMISPDLSQSYVWNEDRDSWNFGSGVPKSSSGAKNKNLFL